MTLFDVPVLAILAGGGLLLLGGEANRALRLQGINRPSALASGKLPDLIRAMLLLNLVAGLAGLALYGWQAGLWSTVKGFALGVLMANVLRMPLLISVGSRLGVDQLSVYVAVASVIATPVLVTALGLALLRA